MSIHKPESGFCYRKSSDSFCCGKKLLYIEVQKCNLKEVQEFLGSGYTIDSKHAITRITTTPQISNQVHIYFGMFLVKGDTEENRGWEITESWQYKPQEIEAYDEMNFRSCYIKFFDGTLRACRKFEEENLNQWKIECEERLEKSSKFLQKHLKNSLK